MEEFALFDFRYATVFVLPIFLNLYSDIYLYILMLIDNQNLKNLEK